MCSTEVRGNGVALEAVVLPEPTDQNRRLVRAAHADARVVAPISWALSQRGMDAIIAQ